MITNNQIILIGVIKIKNTFEDAMYSSNKGFIDRYNDIEEILTRLLDTPIMQLFDEGRDKVVHNMKDVMSELEWDNAKIAELTYGEMLGFTELISTGDVYLDESEQCRDDICLTVLANIRLAIMREKCNDTTLYLFTSISVSAYFDYLATRMGGKGNGIKNMYRVFRSRVRRNTDFTLVEEDTIGMLLDRMANFQSRVWYPCYSIEEFAKEIRESYYDLYYFFIQYVKEAFPHYFDLEKLKEKYAIQRTGDFQQVMAGREKMKEAM